MVQVVAGSPARVLALFVVMALSADGWVQCAALMYAPETSTPSCHSATAESASDASRSTAQIETLQAARRAAPTNGLERCCEVGDWDVPTAINVIAPVSIANDMSDSPVATSLSVVDHRRPDAPIPVPRVARHVRLSVFLI